MCFSLTLKVEYDALKKSPEFSIVIILEKEHYLRLAITRSGLQQLNMSSKHNSSTGVIGFCCCCALHLFQEGYYYFCTNEKHNLLKKHSTFN